MGIKTAELLTNLLVNSSMIKDATTVDYTGSRKKKFLIAINANLISVQMFQESKCCFGEANKYSY